MSYNSLIKAIEDLIEELNEKQCYNEFPFSVQDRLYNILEFHAVVEHEDDKDDDEEAETHKYEVKFDVTDDDGYITKGVIIEADTFQEAQKIAYELKEDEHNSYIQIIQLNE